MTAFQRIATLNKSQEEGSGSLRGHGNGWASTDYIQTYRKYIVVGQDAYFRKHLGILCPGLRCYTGCR